MRLGPVAAVVLDIEGTTGSADHVRTVLFPYARERFADWFAAGRGTERRAAMIEAVRAVAQAVTLDESGAVAQLQAWTDADVKAAPLKALQGEIWATGYRDGTLHGHVYEDVPAALTRWNAAGVRSHVYSSGSVTAQRDWFGHTRHGDLTGLLSGYFDLANAGPKSEAESYRAISRALGVPAGLTLFLSDTADELDAAEAAGWQTLAVRRPGDPRGSAVIGHPVVTDLNAIDPERPGFRPAAPPSSARAK